MDVIILTGQGTVTVDTKDYYTQIQLDNKVKS